MCNLSTIGDGQFCFHCLVQCFPPLVWLSKSAPELLPLHTLHYWSMVCFGLQGAKPSLVPGFPPHMHFPLYSHILVHCYVHIKTYTWREHNHNVACIADARSLALQICLDSLVPSASVPPHTCFPPCSGWPSRSLASPAGTSGPPGSVSCVESSLLSWGLLVACKASLWMHLPTSSTNRLDADLLLSLLRSCWVSVLWHSF